MAWSEFINKQFDEVRALDERHKEARKELLTKQKYELKTSIKAIDLAKRHEQERKELTQAQSRERQILYEKHMNEADVLSLKNSNYLKSYEAQQEQLAHDLQRREERENLKAAREAEAERDKTLIDKLKEKLKKSREKGRSR